MTRTPFAAMIVTVLLSVEPATASAQVASVPFVAISPAASDAATLVDAFHATLKAGDTNAALVMLAEDVVIFEEGGAERSRDEYASHHLEADASFAAVSETTITRRSGWADGDVAWITTEGRTTGLAGDRTIDSRTVETMVLQRGPQGWRIHHIHWSSRAAD